MASHSRPSLLNSKALQRCVSNIFLPLGSNPFSQYLFILNGNWYHIKTKTSLHIDMSRKENRQCITVIFFLSIFIYLFLNHQHHHHNHLHHRHPLLFLKVLFWLLTLENCMFAHTHTHRHTHTHEKERECVCVYVCVCVWVCELKTL